MTMAAIDRHPRPNGRVRIEIPLSHPVSDACASYWWTHWRRRQTQSGAASSEIVENYPATLRAYATTSSLPRSVN
jgi:hypothetical protein